MSVTFANNTNYKYLILSEVAQNQSLFEEFSESMVPSYRKLNENGDFGEYIGYVALKGNKLETFLREKGQWDAMHQRCKDFIGSEHIEHILLSEDPTFKSLRWKNVTQANAKRFEKAAYLTVKPLTRALLKLKEKPENKLNSTLQKALVASVGYSELSSGGWCSIAKGLNKVLVRPVGGKVNSVVKDGGVVELSSRMSAPVEKVARKYSLPLAEPLKEILGNIKTGVKAAAMCAFLAFTAGVDFVDNPSVNDHVDRAAQKVWDLSGSIETGASDLSVLEGSYNDVVHDEVRQGYAPDILDDTTEIAPSVAGSNYEVEQYEPSFEEKLQEEEQRVVKTSYTAKQGDSMWSISEDIAANLISDFEILVDAEGEPSEMTMLVNNIHKSIIDANDLKNPDVIQVGQQVQVGSAVVAILDGSLEERLDFVAELLRPNQDRVLSMSSPRV